MRYKDLIKESVVGSEQGVKDMIQTVIMSLSAQGIDQLPVERIAHILKQRMHMGVPVGTIMDIMSTMPIVSDTTDSQINLQDGPDQNSPEENSKDKVAQMATKGASAEKEF